MVHRKRKFVLQLSLRQALVLGVGMGLVLALGLSTWLSLDWIKDARRQNPSETPTSPLPPTPTSLVASQPQLPSPRLTVLVPRFNLPAETLIERADWFESRTLSAAEVNPADNGMDLITEFKQIQARRTTVPLTAGKPIRSSDTEPAGSVPKLGVGDVQLRLNIETQEAAAAWHVGQRVDLVYEWQTAANGSVSQGRIPRLAIMAVEPGNSNVVTLRIRHRDAEMFQGLRQRPGFRYFLQLSPSEDVGP